MTGTAQAEFAKLHEEFPILNDIQGSLVFDVNDGVITPSSVHWNVDPSFQRQLSMLGIREHVMQLLIKLACDSDNSCCHGKVEFTHGQCLVCW